MMSRHVTSPCSITARRRQSQILRLVMLDVENAVSLADVSRHRLLPGAGTLQAAGRLHREDAELCSDNARLATPALELHSVSPDEHQARAARRNGCRVAEELFSFRFLCVPATINTITTGLLYTA
ncbi:hypothetical protein NDU88_001338 [Pleurodeles waltl]|uniref:Uncharacterized protein n=1 Tax=Pleurodeles waltl TaxID=8319 RepID=A0AAV7L0I2_PLEWA|nr:hypothetical protein NDU88_001338 [Pleurodeles waltl]